ncbi:unnamed protein product [Protopolystoma xenopodis]|uniref:Uncharacterized protein n=1 Tax=Protopolystoma xenopodis TaxID=117903 RepID=A0A3S4ZRR7_9PLAT|nr:unnamed protein product [Protopolystoma xenopodis]
MTSQDPFRDRYKCFQSSIHSRGNQHEGWTTDVDALSPFVWPMNWSLISRPFNNEETRATLSGPRFVETLPVSTDEGIFDRVWIFFFPPSCERPNTRTSKLKNSSLLR